MISVIANFLMAVEKELDTLIYGTKIGNKIPLKTTLLGIYNNSKDINRYFNIKYLSTSLRIKIYSN